MKATSRSVLNRWGVLVPPSESSEGVSVLVGYCANWKRLDAREVRELRALCALSDDRRRRNKRIAGTGRLLASAAQSSQPIRDDKHGQNPRRRSRGKTDFMERLVQASLEGVPRGGCCGPPRQGDALTTH
jgi:hypothetical protein